MMQQNTTLPFAALLAVFFNLAGVLAQEAAGDAAAEGQGDKPYAYVQILNGISPHKVTLSINGQPLYPGIGAGTRISSFGVRAQEWTLDVAKDGSDAVKNFTLKFPRGGFYTLVLTGDFAELPPVVAPDGTKKPDYRVKVSFLANKKPSDRSVDVRVVNGTEKSSLRLLRDKREQCTAAPGESATAAGQPADLYMEAICGNSTIPLYIAQEPPVSNLTVVFYDSSGTTGFRAMTERWQLEAAE